VAGGRNFDDFAQHARSIEATSTARIMPRT